MQNRLAEVNALEHAGKYGEALPVVEEVFEAAQELGYEPLIAESKSRLGKVLKLVGRYEDAAKHLAQASWLAEALGQDEVAADAQISLIGLTGQSQGRFEDAIRWGRHAAALVTRLESAEELKATLMNALSAVYFASGKLEKARVHYEQEVELRVRALGPDHTTVGATYLNLGIIATNQDRTNAATEYYRRAKAIFDKHYGPNHPRMGQLILNVGANLVAAGEYTQAASRLQEALGILVLSFGSDHILVGSAKQELAIVTARMGDPAGAAVLYREAFEIARKAWGSAHPNIMPSLFLVCSALIEAEKLDEASRTIQEASELVQASWPNDVEMQARLSVARSELHVAREQPLDAVRELENTLAAVEQEHDLERDVVFNVLLHLGKALRASHRPKETVSRLKRALDLPIEGKPRAQAEARFELAQALLAAGEAPTVVRPIAQQALATYESGGKALADQQDEVTRWMAKHLDPTR